MVIFNSYVKLPEGIPYITGLLHGSNLKVHPSRNQWKEWGTRFSGIGANLWCKSRSIYESNICIYRYIYLFGLIYRWFLSTSNIYIYIYHIYLRPISLSLYIYIHIYIYTYIYMVSNFPWTQCGSNDFAFPRNSRVAVSDSVDHAFPSGMQPTMAGSAILRTWWIPSTKQCGAKAFGLTP